MTNKPIDVFTWEGLYDLGRRLGYSHKRTIRLLTQAQQDSSRAPSDDPVYHAPTTDKGT